MEETDDKDKQALVRNLETTLFDIKCSKDKERRKNTNKRKTINNAEMKSISKNFIFYRGNRDIEIKRLNAVIENKNEHIKRLNLSIM